MAPRKLSPNRIVCRLPGLDILHCSCGGLINNFNIHLLKVPLGGLRVSLCRATCCKRHFLIRCYLCIAAAAAAAAKHVLFGHGRSGGWVLLLLLLGVVVVQLLLCNSLVLLLELGYLRVGRLRQLLI